MTEPNRECITLTGDLVRQLPKPESVQITDVARALACRYRWNGWTRVPISVAEHSVRVASHLPPEIQMDGLLHDVAEAWIPDFPRPWKAHWRLFGFPIAKVEEQIHENILRGLGVWPLTMSDEERAVLKLEDARALVTEWRDLTRNGGTELEPHIRDSVQPWPNRIVPWTWQMAESRFIKAFVMLLKGTSFLLI